MKSITLLTIGIFSFVNVNAQFMAEDSKGKSTILYSNSNINLDLTETALSFNWNNLRLLDIERPNTILLGLSAYGKNEEGLTALLGGGDFVPSTRVTGLIGLKTKQVFKDYRQEQKLQRELEGLMQDPEIIQLQDYHDFVKTFDRQMKHNAGNLADYKITKIKGIIKNIIYKTRGDFDSVSQKVDSLRATYLNTNENDYADEMRIFLDIITSDHRKFQQLSATESVIRKFKNIDDKADEYFHFRSTTTNRSLFVFFSGGTEAKQFHLYSPADAIDLNKRFVKNTYRSDFIDLVANLDVGARWLIGASIGYQRSNTFDSLVKKEYTVRTTFVQAEQSLITEKKYESYTGDFKFYDRINLRTDLIYFAKVSTEYRLAWNMLYTRWYLSQNNAIANKTTNIGTGLNFYKIGGNFVGGFYFEEQDAFNGNEIRDSDFWKRLAFGLTGKFAFRSILDRNW